MTAHLNGCHNRPRPVAGSVTHQAQAGWRDTVDHDSVMPTRVPVMVDVVHTMSTACQYDRGTTDQGCVGCQHINAAMARPAP